MNMTNVGTQSVRTCDLVTQLTRGTKWLLLTSLLYVAWIDTARAIAQERERHVIVVSLDGLAAYLLDDPKASLPTIRKIASEGCVVEGGMKVVNPSVTWPNHTTLVTGVRPEKHGVLANGMLIRSGIGSPIVVEPKHDQSEMVRVATVVDAAHAAGLTTGDINWPCTRGSKSLDDSFPDVPDMLSHTTPRLRSELVQMGLLDDPTDESFAKKSGPARDWVWTEAACHLIRERKPNLLLVHLLNVDSTHHLLGPQTPGGYTANALIDLMLGRIIDATRDAGILDKTTFIVVSDHGFTTTPKALMPNVMLRQKGFLTADNGKLGAARVHVIPEGGIGLIYCTNPGEADRERKQIRELFINQEGVADVILPDRFKEYGLPFPREYSQAPDAVLVAKDGYSVSASLDGDAFVVGNVEAKTSLGSHGFISTNPRMNALCILWGYGIRKGGKLERIENVDIAPTIADLLGIHEFQADGKSLKAAFETRGN